MGRKLLLLSVLLLFAPPATDAAGDEAIDRATLKGLKSVGVVIDSSDLELEKAGVTRDSLLTLLLARLSKDSIHVDPGAKEFLGLRVLAVRSGRMFAVSLTLGLYQPVQLSRNQEQKTSTQTWEVETILVADPKILQTACKESADMLADRFAEAYRTVNPE
jgi:hypothetical protein